MRPRQAARAAALALAVTVAGAVLAPAPASARPLDVRIDEDFTGYGPARWLDDGAVFGPWVVVFDGVDDGPGVHLMPGAMRQVPQASRTPDQTNSTLVVSRERFGTGPLHLSATWTTVGPRREGVPNAWEVGWLVWDYLDNDHFTYLVLKPNGWELGRRDPTQPGGQRFIRDDDGPTTDWGRQRTVTVDRVGRQTTVRMDGRVLVRFALPRAERNGAVGMYDEDAIVDWTRILVATRR